MTTKVQVMSLGMKDMYSSVWCTRTGCSNNTIVQGGHIRMCNNSSFGNAKKNVQF